jgi:hypothetical protein
MNKTRLKVAIVDAAIFGLLVGMVFCSIGELSKAHAQNSSPKLIEKQPTISLMNLTNGKHGAYIAPVPTHSELSLATHLTTGAQPPKAVFLRPSSGFACSMASHGGKPQGLPTSSFIGSPTPHDLPPILANGCKFNTNNHKTGVIYNDHV